MSRARGEGQVTKLANGKWRARVVKDGRTKNATRPTKREAVAELPRLRAELGLALSSSPTVAGWLYTWMDRADHAEETERLYSRMVEQHLVPHLGHLKVEEVDTPTLQRLYRSLTAAGVGAPTVARAHSVISVALSEAVREGLITFNPAAAAKPPAHRPKKPKPLDPTQARRLLAACRQPEAPSGPIIACILLLGLRVGEAINLRWEHVDHEEVRVPGTKTAGSAAVLPLVPLAREVMGGRREDRMPVFHSARWPAKPTSRQTVHRHLRAYLDALGIADRRVHDLRHSTGSLLASVGVPTRVIQGVLRHTDAAMSVHYSQIHDPAVRDALQGLADSLASS